MTLPDPKLLLLLVIAGGLVLVILGGMVSPRFMAWAAHLVTVVTGFAVTTAILFAALYWVELRSDVRVIGAVMRGDTTGLTASEQRTLEQLRSR